jgi:hypothetical protein
VPRGVAARRSGPDAHGLIDHAEPGVRRQESSGHERDPRLDLAALRCAAPRPVLRAADESCPQRPSLDVMTGLQQVPRRVDGVDRGRFEGDHWGVLRSPHASQPHVVGSGYPAQERRQSIRLSRTDDQVPSMRQNAVRDQPHRMTTQSSIQNGEKRAIVGRSEKDRPAVRRIADHVEEPRSDSRLPRCRHSTVSFHDDEVSHASKVGAVRRGRQSPLPSAVA